MVELLVYILLVYQIESLNRKCFIDRVNWCLFLFKKKVTQIVSGVIHNSNKINSLYLLPTSSENIWMYCWMNLCCWNSWKTISFSHNQILAVYHKKHIELDSCSTEVEKCILLRIKLTYSSEKDTEWESKCSIAADTSMEEFPLHRKQRSKAQQPSHQLPGSGMETATKTTHFSVQPS